ncbi:MAG TPA: hypothetical protein VG013_01685 [Gemmataceae bacterium]|nr:hypothetical protein [Gemmataceae bacterium]
MQDLLIKNPWLIPCILGLLIPLTAIIFGTVSTHLRKVRQAELDAGLKHDMLERGMSPEEIKTVLEASSRGASRRKSCSRA